MRSSLPVLVCTGALLLPTILTAQPDAAEALARQVEERHAELRTLRAEFVQTYRSGALGRTITESGTVAIRRPGRMRWEYRAPDHKLFVSDGETAYFYVPEDRQVTVKQIEGSEALAFRLLAGDLALREEFTPTLGDTPGKDGARLVLTPRDPSPDLAQITLDLDEQRRIVGIEILDAEGNRSRFAFRNLRENPQLPDSLFRFSIPEGVEVISG